MSQERPENQDQTPAEAKGRWEAWELRIGVVSGAIGLGLAILGAPSAISKIVSNPADEILQMEREHKERALREAAPRLEVSYVFMDGYLYQMLQSVGAGAEADIRGNPYLHWPVLTTEVAHIDHDRIDSMRALLPADAARPEAYTPTILFLVVRNRGQSDATGVELVVDRLRLNGPVRVRESATGGDDYVERLRAAAVERNPMTLKFPRVLEPGGGLLVPLFYGQGGTDDEAYQWAVLSGVAYLPSSVRYADGITGSRDSVSVRRMVNPMRVANGIMDRG